MGSMLSQLLNPNLNEPVNPPGGIVASKSKAEKSNSNANKPSEVALVFLAGDPDVHAPEARNDVHRQDNGTKDRKFVEAVSRLLRALRHLQVDLREIVSVRSGEDPESPS